MIFNNHLPRSAPNPEAVLFFSKSLYLCKSEHRIGLNGLGLAACKVLGLGSLPGTMGLKKSPIKYIEFLYNSE